MTANGNLSFVFVLQIICIIQIITGLEIRDSSKGQCRCVMPPGTTTCMPIEIDPSFQAATLEEALFNFVKPNELKPMAKPNPLSGPTKNGYFGKLINCGSNVCKRCAGKILADLEKQSLEQGAAAKSTYQEIGRLKAKYGAVKGDCPGLVAGPSNTKSMGCNGCMEAEALSSEFTHVLTLDCTGRGESVEGSVYMSLCNTCWQWGVLKDKYYPRYVNMMTCQEDDGCLTNFGKCRQRTRSVQVLKRKPNSQPPFKPYSVNVPVCCDCQVESGTALHDLVTG